MIGRWPNHHLTTRGLLDAAGFEQRLDLGHLLIDRRLRPPRLACAFLGWQSTGVDWAFVSLLLAAEDRRPISPPTTQSTMHRPSNDKPNHTAGEKMILDAQVPKATTAFQSNLSSPLKYRQSEQVPSQCLESPGPCFPVATRFR